MAMAAITKPQPDFAILPEMLADVFSAALKKPAHVEDDQMNHYSPIQGCKIMPSGTICWPAR
ncbi:hypothetical protein IM511_06810 [Erythrobacteraceae bacterium E2-1 Yellow Sea]|nr:hypothetical protein [Erythrobacteraceae bacterium E2-1 Yellow Sea]